MKNLTKREAVMLIVLVIVLALAGYYNFFLKGHLERNLNVDDEVRTTIGAINDAKLKQAAIQITEKSIEEIGLEIAEYSENVLPGLDRPEILRMLDRSIYPYITNSVISFSSSYTELGSNYIFNVIVSFQTKRADYIVILEKLREEKMVSRVVTSSMALIDVGSDEATCSITLEFLTENNPPFTFQME